MSTPRSAISQFKPRTAAEFLEELQREHPRKSTVALAAAPATARTAAGGIRADYKSPAYVPWTASSSSSSASLSGNKYASPVAQTLASPPTEPARAYTGGPKSFLATSSSPPPVHKYSGSSWSGQTLGSPPTAVARRPGTAAGSQLVSTGSSATPKPVSATVSGVVPVLAVARHDAFSATPPNRTDSGSSADSPPVTPVKRAADAAAEEEAHLSTCKERTYIILDWDDTLLPSCVSTAFSCDQALPAPVRQALDALSNDVLGLLKVCRAHGQVVIITNAAHGWVQDSGKQFLPAVLRYLQENSVPIISAQQEWYQHRQLHNRIFYSYLHDPAQWKPASFATHVLAAGRALQNGDGSFGSWDGERKLNLISIGDANFERMAAQALVQRPYSRRYIALCKTIKFDENPTLSRLQVQLQSLTAAFPALVSATTSLDLDMTPHWQ